MNLFPSTIGEDGSVLMDAFMGKVSIGRTTLPQGKLVTAGIRAESLVLSETVGKGLQVTAAPASLIVPSPARKTLPPPPGDRPLEGKTVWLSLPQATIHLYDRLNGLRIEEGGNAKAGSAAQGDRIIA